MIKLLIIFLFIFTTSSFSEIKKVSIVGNTRVNSNTIESLVDKKVVNVDSIYINNLTKKIYDTDFFSDVTDDILFITSGDCDVVSASLAILKQIKDTF